MSARHEELLSPHCRNVLAELHKSDKPLSAYELLDRLRGSGVKAPPTIYRALETLMGRGMVHRIETLGAFVACCDEKGDETYAQFAVCRSCGSVKEIHDKALAQSIKALAAKLKFHIEREMMELMGLCERCNAKQGKA